jgi:LysM repeat protein
MVVALLAADLPPVNAQATNLLTNGGFELSGGSTGASGWSQWWAEVPRPSDGSYNYAYKPRWNLESLSAGAASALIYAGNSSQRIINNWDPWHAGVKQVVNAPAGSRVRLTAYARLWAASANWPATSDTSATAGVQVGIEPNGNDNAFASSVVWSGAISPHNAWQPVAVEATVGSSGKVAVFLSANYRGHSRFWLAAFFDEATLFTVSGTPATNPPNPTPTPLPTNAPPAATSTPVPTTSGSTGTTVYVVQRGDTLGGIARRFGVSLSALISANNIRNANLIFVGQRLIIPGGSGAPGPTPTPGTTTGSNIYIVQRGDNLTRIAARFGTTVQRLMELNGLRSDLIYIGQRLIVR